MDLDEYALTEAQRTLKRLGVTHLWRRAVPAQPPAPSPAGAAITAPGNAEAKVAAPPSSRGEGPLPPLLRTLFHGKQPPVGALWTYAGLYSDLQQAAVPARLDMFRKIQASVRSLLGWSDNDLGAWPLDIPPGLFRQGLRFFAPRIVIAFGNDGRAQDMGHAEAGATAQPLPTVITLPDLGAMAAGDKQLKNDAWQTLQGIRP